MGLIGPVSVETTPTLVQRQNAKTAENKAFSAVAALEIERFEQGCLARPRLPFSKLSLHAREH